MVLSSARMVIVPSMPHGDLIVMPFSAAASFLPSVSPLVALSASTRKVAAVAFSHDQLVGLCL